MNSEFSPTPQEELEAQITALLLGELPEEEAAALRERIAADPALRKLHTQIGTTIGLVKEAITSPQPAEIAAPEGLTLSEQRREQLLASFKLVKVPKREVRIDFKTWGALAAMIAGLLSFSYWMMGAFFVKARYSAQQLAAVEDAESGASLPRTETHSSHLAAATEPPNQILTSGGASRESAPQDARFRKEVGQAANAPAAGRGPVEENRLAHRYGVELPKIATPSGNVIQDPASTGIVPENPAPTGPKSQSASMRGFFDESAAGRTTTGLADTEPAAASSSPAFGLVPATPAERLESDLKEMKGNVPAQMEKPSVGVVAGLFFPDAKVITQTDAVPIDGELQIAQKDSKRLGWSLATEQLGEREVALKQDKDQARNISENLDQVGGGAEGKLAAISPAQADRVQDLEQLTKAPAGSVTAGAEIGQQYEPLAFYRRNPELMKRYFPHLFRANETQPQLPQVEGASAGTPVTSEVEKLRRDLKAPEQILDLQVPSTAPVPKRVIILQPAEAKELTFWERVRGAERKVVVEIKDGPDKAGIMAVPTGYDPYFIQTEFEKVKSSTVLGEVVERLSLSQEWGNKADGQKLDKKQAIEQLQKMVNLGQSARGLIEIKVRSKESEEAARIANTIAEVYQEKRNQLARTSQLKPQAQALPDEPAKQESALAKAKAELQKLEAVSKVDPPVAKPVANAPIPQPEVAVATNPFSTFSLNVSDVSFKLAAASFEKGVMPEAAGIRSEEFINAFDYRDPAALSAPVAFAWERARYPFAHDRDLLRFSVKTAASGREAGRPLNLVLLLDSSGSMERADRVRIIQECLRVLAGQLQAQDKVSVVTFARTPRLWVDGLPGSSAGELVTRIGTVTPEGGTNLEEAMRVGYETVARHFVAKRVNRLVLLTDGAANLGEVNAELLKKRVEENRQKGIALDCFGIGWEGLNDDLLEQLSRNGDGRYGFVNTPEAASAEFAGQLAGALKVAASDVKVQVEFNPKRAAVYRQIGYAKHQLTKEQFRDNTVDAAEIGAAEAGNALYVVQTYPAGEGPIATVRVRFKVPGTNDYLEHEWPVPYEGAAKPLEHSSPGIRLAAAASGFSEWLAASPYAGEITPDRLLGVISNVPGAFPNDSRPKQLEWMIRQAKSIAGK